MSSLASSRLPSIPGENWGDPVPGRVDYDTQHCLPAVATAGMPPVAPVLDRRSLTDRRTPARTPVASRRAWERRAPRHSSLTSKVRRTGRSPGSRQRCLPTPHPRVRTRGWCTSE
jgi:hypothetical protein